MTWTRMRLGEARKRQGASMKACASQVMGIVLALCASLAWVGCGKKTQEYRMDQPINMGPFSFEVERTEDSVKLVHPSEGPTLEIRVYYRMLDNKTPPFGKTFDSNTQQSFIERLSKWRRFVVQHSVIHANFEGWALTGMNKLHGLFCSLHFKREGTHTDRLIHPVFLG